VADRAGWFLPEALTTSSASRVLAFREWDGIEVAVLGGHLWFMA
jgi:hypothetical protein